MKKKDGSSASGMDQIKKKSKGKKMVKWIILAVVLLVIAFGVYSCQNAAKKAMDVLQNMQAKAVVTTRPLIKSVAATGKIVSLSRKSVATELTSDVDVTDVFVEVGDFVEAGDKLVAFDTTDIEEALADAQSALKRTQSTNGISISDSRRRLTDSERDKDYYLTNEAQSLADAQKNYKDTVEKYDDLDDDVDDAEDDRDDAKKAYDQLVAQLAAAQKELEAAQTVSGNDAGIVAKAAAAYNDLKTKTDAAGKVYEDKEQAYKSLKAELQTMRDQEEVKKSKDALDEEQRKYDKLVADQDSAISSAKSGLSQAQLGTDTTSQQRTIEAYEKQLRHGIVTAPVSGMVTSVNVEKGEKYNPASGAIAMIQDVSAFEIEAEIGQYDISDITVGQKVLIKTDATGDEELEGTVIKVSPVATTKAAGTNSDVTYTVRIEINTPNDRLRLDMTASLSIIVTEHENALTVPYNAIQRDEDGNHFVEIPTADGINTEKKYVQVVMESNYYTEIAPGDLEEGTEVILNNSSDELEDFFEGGFF